MRRFLLCFSALVFTGPVWAEEFEVETSVSRVTVFPQGALITRQAIVDIPGGRHQIILREPSNSFDDLPHIILPGGEGLRLISAEVADLNGVPAVSEDSELYQSRLAELNGAKAELAGFLEGDIALEADLAAARTILRAVESLAGPSGNLVGSEGPIDPEATLDLVTRMSVKAFEAQAKLDRATLALDERETERSDLIRKVEIAEAALAETPRDVLELSTFILTIEASRRVAGALRMESFTSEASWGPSYRLDLDYEGMDGELAITREAVISQNSGLSWEDTRVTLSTANPREATSVELPRENILRLAERFEPRVQPSIASGSRAELDVVAESMMLGVEELPAPVMETVPVGAGEPIEYKLSEKISLASGISGGILVEIDELILPVELFAEAIAPRDTTAKLATKFTYDRGGIMLAGETDIFHNGSFVGNGFIPEISSGDEAEIGLGPLKSVLIKHRVISREEGDRGLLTSSNARELRTETEVVNLSGFEVPLKLYDVLPVSESEDLRVTEISQPNPDVRNVEGRRGVLEWQLDLEANETQIIRFGYDLAWPKDFDVISK